MNKTILILGAGSDIGIRCAHEFAAYGFNVTLAARDLERAAADANDIAIRHAVNTDVVEFNAEDIAGHNAFYSSLATQPDVILYAAGYLGEQETSQIDTSELKRVIDINFTGAASILSVVAEAFQKRGSGSIIGISSVAGDRGRQSNYIYGAAKAGFSTFLAGLRHRFANTEVHVLTVKPGFVATKMTDGMDLPKALTATPEAVAAAIYKAYVKKKRTLYYLPAWRLIMWSIREVPEFIFVKTKL